MKKLIISTICACVVVLLAASHGATASSINRHSVIIPKQSLLVVLAGFGCNFVNGQLVCGKSGKKKNSENDDNDGDQPKKSEDKEIPKTCGKKVNCEAGFVKLEKPNKFGACCEVREGLCPTGFSGSPPHCSVCGSVSANDAEAATTIFKNERPQCKNEGVAVQCQKVVNGTSDCCCTL